MKLNLKALRANKGLTMIEASKLIGVHFQSLKNWESGKFAPKYIHLKKISEVYGIDIEDIIL